MGCELKIFYLYRKEDDSGISGTGRVAQGFVADNGRVALFWLSDHPSVTVYDNIGEVQAIHGHEGKTELKMEPEYKRAYFEIMGVVENFTLLPTLGSQLPPEGAAVKLLNTSDTETPKEENGEGSPNV